MLFWMQKSKDLGIILVSPYGVLLSILHLMMYCYQLYILWLIAVNWQQTKSVFWKDWSQTICVGCIHWNCEATAWKAHQASTCQTWKISSWWDTRPQYYTEQLLHGSPLDQKMDKFSRVRTDGCPTAEPLNRHGRKRKLNDIHHLCSQTNIFVWAIFASQPLKLDHPNGALIVALAEWRMYLNTNISVWREMFVFKQRWLFEKCSFLTMFL